MYSFCHCVAVSGHYSVQAIPSGNAFVCSSVDHQIADILLRLVPYLIGTMPGICAEDCNNFVTYCCSLTSLRRTACLTLAGWFWRTLRQPDKIIIQNVMPWSGHKDQAVYILQFVGQGPNTTMIQYRHRKHICFVGCK
jgi:hypothetical protein